MRYLIQIFVMVSDIMLIVACGYIIFFLGILGLPIVALATMAWRETGGFMAWHPSKVAKFMEEARKLGL